MSPIFDSLGEQRGLTEDPPPQEFGVTLAGACPVDNITIRVHPAATPHQGGTTKRTSRLATLGLISLVVRA